MMTLPWLRAECSGRRVCGHGRLLPLSRRRARGRGSLLGIWGCAAFPLEIWKRSRFVCRVCAFSRPMSSGRGTVSANLTLYWALEAVPATNHQTTRSHEGGPSQATTLLMIHFSYLLIGRLLYLGHLRYPWCVSSKLQESEQLLTLSQAVLGPEDMHW